jgi:hypothetical protein
LPSIVWNAHDNNDPAHERAFPLCCKATGSMTMGCRDGRDLSRHRGPGRGSVCRDISALHARIAAELVAGIRRVDKSIEHKAGTPEERRARALKAVETGRRNGLAKLRAEP